MLPCGTSPMVWYSKRTVVYIIFWDHKQESEQEVFNTWEEQPMIAVELSKHVFYLSIPRYIQAALHKFQHNPATRKEHVPHIWERPNYVAKQQFAKAEDTSQKLPPERIQVL